MLKDLEKRHSPMGVHPQLQLFTKSKSRHHLLRRSFFYVLLASLLILTFLIMVTYSRQDINKLSKSHFKQHLTQPKNLVDATKKPSVDSGTITAGIKPLTTPHQDHREQSPAPPALVPMTTIKSIELKINDNMTAITFLLDKPTLYEITSAKDSHEFIVTLESARLQAPLPAIKEEQDNALKQISMESKGKNLQFNLALKPDVEVKAIETNNNEGPGITIKLENHKNNQAKETSLPKADVVKMPVMQTLLLEQYQSALNLIKEQKYPLAIKKLNSILKYDPNHTEARLTLAALLLDQSLLDEASQVIDEGLKIDPSYSPLVQLKARVFADQGDLDQALLVLQTVSPSVEEDPDYHAFMATIHERRNEDLFSIRIYRKLLTMNDRNGNWWFGLGASLEKIGQRHAALDAYTRALEAGNVTPATSVYLYQRLSALREHANERG